MVKNTILFVVTLSTLTWALYVNKTGSSSVELKDDPPRNRWERKAQLETPKRMHDLATETNQVANWPPVLGERFPNVEFHDHHGDSFSIDSLRGKPTVIELIAMSCAGCQAFAGGNEYGAFGEFARQSNLQSFETYFERYTHHDLKSANVNFVQIVFYDLELQAPSSQELNDWRRHFGLDRQANAFVISGGKPLANKVSYSMIPGFLLLDADQVIRYDSTGHHPRHNLYTELLPAAKRMLD